MKIRKNIKINAKLIIELENSSDIASLISQKFK
jgi:hypothetical protein